MNFFEKRIKQGETRLVFLVGNYAIKTPNFLKGYRQFLYGLISNHQEKAYSNSNPNLLPVIFSCIGSLFIIFPRAKVLTEIDHETFLKVMKPIGDYPRVDYKAESFGVWKNKVYVIDYGTTYF